MKKLFYQKAARRSWYNAEYIAVHIADHNAEHSAEHNASGGSRNLFWGAKPSFPIESWGRSPNWGRFAPSIRIEGEARVEGAKRLRIEGETWTEGEAREKAGEGSEEGARWAPPQKIFEKSNLKPFILMHIWGKHLK